MGKVFITGSSDGIGLKTGQELLSMGHDVVFHARNSARADELKTLLEKDVLVVTGDLSSLGETETLAAEAEKLAPYDAIIHNAGIGGGGGDGRVVTSDGIERIFQVNVIAPYLLTSLMSRSEKMIYLSSGLEANGRVRFDDLMHEQGVFDSMQAYSDSKLYDVMLAFAVSRLWSGVLSNAVDPGWIRTKLGGPSATDNLDRGAETQLWLVDGSDPASLVTGKYFKWKKELAANPAAYDTALQDKLLELCADLTGVKFPG
ncbi:MAG: SDR family NAD(P)-dependent oxidoreductase [Firmicutes bacterium]|nr:SDR family NAD(P)-dependent oxidoreductase [Bacillota bacterium]